MPKKPTRGLRGYHLEMEEDVMERVRELAQANGRPLRDEVTHALLRHLASPPIVRVEVDAREMPDVPAPEKRRRGRPPKQREGGTPP